MHPNAAFRTDDRALLEALIAEVGFGMVFAQTPTARASPTCRWSRPETARSTSTSPAATR